MILGVYVTATAPGGSPVELRYDTLVGASITQGSAGLLEAVEPATLSLTILDPAGAWRNVIGFATRLEVAIGGPPGSWTNPQTRFVGTVTDMRVTYDNAWLLSIIAVGPKMASRTILVDPRPQETAAARIEAAWNAAGLTIHAVDSAGSVTLLPTTALATASDLTSDAARADLGLIAERRDGSMWYRARDTVAASQLVKAVLPATGIFLDSEWVKSLQDLATRVTCGWGTAEPQATTSAINTTLETDLGRVQERAHSTTYALESEATATANELLGRLGGETWRTETLHIDLALSEYDATRTQNVLDLEVGDVVWVQGAPQATPAGDEETYVVLGWREDLDGDRHQFNLVVVEYGLLRDTARWGNVGMSWATAGTTPVGSYNFTPPTLGPGVQP